MSIITIITNAITFLFTSSCTIIIIITIMLYK